MLGRATGSRQQRHHDRGADQPHRRLARSRR